MRCPACGIEIPASSHRCPNCQAPLQRGVAAAVLTPPPEDAATRIAVPAMATDTTGLPPSGQTEPSFDQPTIVGVGARPDVFGDVTTMAPASTDQDTQTRAAVTPRQSNAAGTRRQSAPSAASDSEDTGPLKPGKPFGSRYHIIRLLGLGGMGALGRRSVPSVEENFPLASAAWP